MPINPPHQTSTRKTRAALSRLVPRGWFVDQNAPISLPLSDSEPEPDVVVIRGELQDFAERHPGPGDTALAIEVAHSSLTEDRGFQKRLYAVEGIPAYWIVNLVDLQIEVYTEPSGPSEAPDYQTRRDYKPGDSVPFVIEAPQRGLIPVDSLLP
jgi:Uma2 family endonuclease